MATDEAAPRGKQARELLERAGRLLGDAQALRREHDAALDAVHTALNVIRERRARAEPPASRCPGSRTSPGGGCGCGTLEKAGYATVLDVLNATPYELQRLPRGRPAHPAAGHAAARQIAGAAQEVATEHLNVERQRDPDADHGAAHRPAPAGGRRPRADARPAHGRDARRAARRLSRGPVRRAAGGAASCPAANAATRRQRPPPDDPPRRRCRCRGRSGRDVRTGRDVRRGPPTPWWSRRALGRPGCGCSSRRPPPTCCGARLRHRGLGRLRAALRRVLRPARRGRRPRRATSPPPRGSCPTRSPSGSAPSSWTTPAAGVSLRGYQAFGARFALVQRRVILGDEMGLGKTDPGHRRDGPPRGAEGATHFLVVCPASVLINWTREVEARSTLRALPAARRRPAEACGRLAGARRRRGDHVRRAGRAARTRRRRGSAMLVVDEAHYVKNPRGQAVAGGRRLVRPRPSGCCSSPARRWRTGSRSSAPWSGYLQPADSPDRGTRRAAPAPRRSGGRGPGLPAPQPGGRAHRAARAGAGRRVGGVRRRGRGGLPGRGARRATSWPCAGPRSRVAGEVRQAGPPARNRRGGRATTAARSWCSPTSATCWPSSSRRSALRSAWTARRRPLIGPITGSVPTERRQQVVDDVHRGARAGRAAGQIEAGGVGLNIQAASVVILCEPQVKPTIEAPGDRPRPPDGAGPARAGAPPAGRRQRRRADAGACCGPRPRCSTPTPGAAHLAEATPDAVDVSDTGRWPARSSKKNSPARRRSGEHHGHGVRARRGSWGPGVGTRARPGFYRSGWSWWPTAGWPRRPSRSAPRPGRRSRRRRRPSPGPARPAGRRAAPARRAGAAARR